MLIYYKNETHIIEGERKKLAIDLSKLKISK